MPLPGYLQLEPVGQCNLRCQMCPIPFREDGPPHGPPAFMAWGTFTRILDQLPELRELHLQGLGEPMMHPCFFDMVEYAAARGVTVSTNSNLTLLSSARARRCVASGLEWLHVSIDARSPELYAAIRRRSRLDRVLTNLRGLLQARRELGTNRPHLRMVSVVMRQNLAELPDLVELAAEYGFDALFVQHLCHDFGEDSLPTRYRPMREFVDRQTLLNEDLDRIERYFEAARQRARVVGVELRLPRARPRPTASDATGRQRCSWPWTGGYVSYQGRAMPCCMIATPDRLTLGDVGSASFAEVWDSDAYRDFRDRLASPTPPSICSSCAVYNGIF
ncbi:MAG: SPASM domain-containing protein [Chloroflexi bacterium]|nr:SPASM domain-containing protein [Chloroflexota bacterium]